MSEIFVEEENTVYELDAECLRRKEQQEKHNQNYLPVSGRYKTQGIGESKNIFWILCLLCFMG